MTGGQSQVFVAHAYVYPPLCFELMVRLRAQSCKHQAFNPRHPPECVADGPFRKGLPSKWSVKVISPMPSQGGCRGWHGGLNPPVLRYRKCTPKWYHIFVLFGAHVVPECSQMEPQMCPELVGKGFRTRSLGKRCNIKSVHAWQCFTHIQPSGRNVIFTIFARNVIL